MAIATTTSPSVTESLEDNARRAADMVGNLFAEVAIHNRAEAGDLRAATLIGSAGGRRPLVSRPGRQGSLATTRTRLAAAGDDEHPFRS